MTDIFYYVAILYIISEIISLKDTFTWNKEETKFVKDITEDLPEDIVGVYSYYGRLVNSLEEFGLKKIGAGIGTLFLSAWLIIGVLYADESNIFLDLIFINIILIITPLIGTVIISLNSKEFFVSKLMTTANDLVKSNAYKIICSFGVVLKIIGASYILYNHFWLVIK